MMVVKAKLKGETAMKKLKDFIKGISVYAFFAFLVWFLSKTSAEEERISGFFTVIFVLACVFLILGILSSASSKVTGKPRGGTFGELLDSKDIDPWIQTILAAILAVALFRLL